MSRQIEQQVWMNRLTEKTAKLLWRSTAPGGIRWHLAVSGGSQRWSEIIVRDSQRQQAGGCITERYSALGYDGLVIKVVPSLPEVPNFQEGKIRKKLSWQNLAKIYLKKIRGRVLKKMLDFLISFIEVRKKFENAISPGPPQQKQRIS